MNCAAEQSPPIIVLDGTTTADRILIGGKAWSLQRMLSLGIPVPPAFAVTTEACRAYSGGAALPDDIRHEMTAAMAALESMTGRRFGASRRPLLVSVRSGAAASMPGMMDTVLNLGITEEVEQALADRHGTTFAADTARRFREQFGKIVGIPPPEDPWEQLHLAIIAVIESWNSPRAVGYRRGRGLPDTGGTAITVQAMVFGNLDDRSGTGVVFTRNPLTGAAEPYGEWLASGQGEDVVSGRADARNLSDLAVAMPGLHAELLAVAARLETDGRDVQDVEFTVESGTLWLLQTRTAKRSPVAAVRHAVQLRQQGLITTAEALDRVLPEYVGTLLMPHLDPVETATTVPVATGKPACPGIATGIVVIDTDDAEQRADRGEAVILARPTTDPEDVAAMSVAAAVITELGGSTSHAAVVCRELAVPCVVGCGAGVLTALAGRTVTVDASTGAVYPGEITIVPPTTVDDPDLALLSRWVGAQSISGAPGSLPEMLRQRRMEQSR